MNSLFQAEEVSSTGKKVAVAIVILTVFGFGVWVGGEMAFRLFGPLRQGPVSTRAPLGSSRPENLRAA